MACTKKTKKEIVLNSQKSKVQTNRSYPVGNQRQLAPQFDQQEKIIRNIPMAAAGDDDVHLRDYGAFIQRFRILPRDGPAVPLPLQGLTFAVKDIFDVSGYVTGFGNPEWARTHAAAATSTAPAVLAVVDAGATCVGKTVMDEMAFSVNGENVHYGTPINPCAPDRAPGGSSSGAAVAVAAKLVDFSLGTDTGGSVRVPAAYCGVFGFRPSHSVVSTANVVPFAQSFDTVGWFARDPNTLRRVGQVLLQLPFDATSEPTHVIAPEDCFLHLVSSNDKTHHSLVKSIEKTFGCNVIKQENLGDYLLQKVPSLESFRAEMPEGQASIIEALSVLATANKVLQRIEFRANHAEWIDAAKPEFGPGISERLTAAMGYKDGHRTLRIEFQAAMDALLEDYGVLAIPTVTGPPPKLRTLAQNLGDFRANAFRSLCIAGLSGICEVTVPLGMHGYLPVSISLLARKGRDHFLLNFAQRIYGSLREQATVAWEENP